MLYNTLKCHTWLIKSKCWYSSLHLDSCALEMCKKNPQIFLCLVFYSKQMATGARQCLSTGHRKQQDFLLWTLPLWTLVAQIKSSASISGQCASCKVFGGDVSGRTVRLLNWQLSRSATLYIRVLRTLLALWQDIYCAFRPSSRQQRKLEWMFGNHLSKLVERESFLSVVLDKKLGAFQG